MFTLTIETGNAAFADEGWGAGEELARILRDLAETLALGLHYEETGASVLDVNGNRVGTWTYKS